MNSICQTSILCLVLTRIVLSSSSSSSSAATLETWCTNLTSTIDQEKPCFLEPLTWNPGRLRSSGNTLLLPCHVARSKHSTVEWWYQNFQKTMHIKIYPVFPVVRPSVVRFISKLGLKTKASYESDVTDVSVMLRNADVDDSGIYQCVIRPWSSYVPHHGEQVSYDYKRSLPTLSYHVQLTGPRLCQSSLSSLPCFSGMGTSSPTILDAYQTTFLQCVVENNHRPISVSWVVGNETDSSVLIRDHLSINQYQGDRLRRVFPLSSNDFSIELSLNRDVYERSYSCVISGVSAIETSSFIYIIRTIDIEEIQEMNSMNWDKTILSKAGLDALSFARQTASNDYRSVSNSTENEVSRALNVMEKPQVAGRPTANSLI